MSDEDDYMSDKFLEGSETSKPPSLLFSKAQQREMEILKKKAEAEERMRVKNKSVKVLEREKREEGLSSALSSDNKGFEMLMKMGYKPGQGIGKSEAGLSEPISVDVKTDRLGLGKISKLKLPKNSKFHNPIAKLEELKTDDFRSRMALRKMEQLIESDLYKSQKVCEQLDTKNACFEPREVWFWPDCKQEQDENEGEEEGDEQEEEFGEEEEEIPTGEKLEILTKYLRDKYFYCVWCGATYENDEDLRDNCPGSTRNDH